jgi:hypothetical protein
LQKMVVYFVNCCHKLLLALQLKAELSPSLYHRYTVTVYKKGV